MFTRSVNAACINRLFTYRTMGTMSDVHPSIQRLLLAAQLATAKSSEPITDYPGVGYALGASAAVITNWKARGVSKQGAIKAAARWHCTVAWILDGKGSPLGDERQAYLIRDRDASEPVIAPRWAPAMRNVREVPVFGQTQGGMPERIWDDGDHQISDKFAEVSTTDEHAFACRVVGDSMVPRYMPGEYALVEPGTAPELEDDVLVRLVSGETMIKRLLSRRGGIRLGSYNISEVLSFEPGEISWMYYVAHPIPARRIQQRVDEPPADDVPMIPGGHT